MPVTDVRIQSPQVYSLVYQIIVALDTEQKHQIKLNVRTVLWIFYVFEQ